MLLPPEVTFLRSYFYKGSPKKLEMMSTSRQRGLRRKPNLENAMLIIFFIYTTLE
jgi:hypothetical protein